MAFLKAEDYRVFEDIKRVSEDGQSEWWSARELSEALGYTQWRNFQKAVDRAMASCENSGQPSAGHFAPASKMAEIGSSTFRKVPDYELTRYACYLIVQNADPHKEAVALGQTYFAIQTRRAEVSGALSELDEASKRLAARGSVRQWNILLAKAALRAGALTEEEFLVFQNAGYMGLYGGLTVADIHERKGLAEGESILDYMGSAELIANLFRMSQTEERLKKEGAKNAAEASGTHFEVAEKIRQALIGMGAALPEDMPKEESVKEAEQREIEKLRERKLILDE
ncbi:MAG: DNA damage-inducible protein D [Eubacteriaceae bacterium]|jgi:DNA-damage-inducible protein D|nr:DNA damage-inducible protein D [Eubacteriaceae bacterium]